MNSMREKVDELKELLANIKRIGSELEAIYNRQVEIEDRIAMETIGQKLSNAMSKKIDLVIEKAKKDEEYKYLSEHSERLIEEQGKAVVRLIEIVVEYFPDRLDKDLKKDLESLLRKQKPGLLLSYAHTMVEIVEDLILKGEPTREEKLGQIYPNSLNTPN